MTYYAATRDGNGIKVLASHQTYGGVIAQFADPAGVHTAMQLGIIVIGDANMLAARFEVTTAEVLDAVARLSKTVATDDR